jgi:RNA polymerase subunit RPABC4/transcription elongation factor Spt4
MAQCGSCGAILGAGDAFCAGCGSPAPSRSVCSSCQATLEPDDQFCPLCGTPVAPTAGAVTQVTMAGDPACPSCRAALQPGDRFCPVCGGPVGVASVEQTQVLTPVQTVSAPAYATAPPAYGAAPAATPFASAGGGGEAPVVPAAAPESRSSSRILVLVATGVVVAIAIAAAFFLVVDRHKSQPPAGSAAAPAASAQTNDAASPAAAAATSADEMKPLVKKMESWMRSSAAGRNDIQSAVNGTYSFAMQPSDAAALVSGVVSNRQSLLAQVRATPAPTDKNARRMLALMQASLTWSLAADKSFRTWIDQSAQAQAMGAGRAPLNAAYKAGVAKSKRANTVKAALAELVDSSAAAYGLRSDWTSSDF